MFLQGNYNGYQIGLAQLGLEDPETRREQLCLDFAKKCIKHKKLSHMFPKSEKEHKMNTRKEEFYKVQHANTGRFQKSAIIYMQNLLNDDLQKNRD